MQGIEREEGERIDKERRQRDSNNKTVILVWPSEDKCIAEGSIFATHPDSSTVISGSTYIVFVSLPT